MLGATLNNQNRLHLGYHYPRFRNGRQSALGFKLFKNEFEPRILDGFLISILLAVTTPRWILDNIEFCHKANLPLRRCITDIGIKTFRVVSVHMKWFTMQCARHLVLERLGAEKVSIYCESLVTSIVREEAFTPSNSVQTSTKFKSCRKLFLCWS